MTAQMFRSALKDLNMTQIRAAQFLRVRPTTVNRWARGVRKVPGPVAAALECLRDHRRLEARIGYSTSTSTSASGSITALNQRHHIRSPKL